MINELYELSNAIERAGIQVQSWYRKYKPIPNISAKAPCIRVTISDGQVIELSAVEKELGAGLRKFGTNQGSYPCMNLAPLYRITDEEVKKEIIKIRPEDLDAAYIEKIRGWCTENNWSKKFQNKYKISMENTPNELTSMLADYVPLRVLIGESNRFLDPACFHQELENAIFRMLDNKENISLALDVLFHLGNPEKDTENDFGSLSIALESPRLIDMGIPAVSAKFTEGLNKALLLADSSGQDRSDYDAVDAFGIPFEPIEEPMPEVKLAGGFDVKLRTMFKEQRCQTRYGRIENASYPISPQIRKSLQAALNWLGSAEHKEITWINTDKNEILFAYPSQLPDGPVGYTRMFKRPEKKDTSFREQAKLFLTELKQGKKPESDSHADWIQLFILRKIDKARTKIVYTRQTNPYELETCSEIWASGCSDNLPGFLFGQPNVPFPLDAADILNRFWKQNGELATDKFKPIPKYHGMELLLEPDTSVYPDLHILSEKAMALGSFLGKKLTARDTRHPIWEKIKDMLALMGLLLYRAGIGKDKYMDSFPYLYGQLLKASDELHALYCNAVRGGDLPTQLAGGSLFQSATEAPIRTLNLLSQRMNPYITWAKSYRTKNNYEAGKESWRAGWLLSLYEKIATQLFSVWTTETRFNDEEKAQLFIGYLAAFPKKVKDEDNTILINQTEEEQEHE